MGGLDENVDQALLKAAFIPFGEIKGVSIPIDFQSGKNRGFAFVEFEEVTDAEAAIDNMHQAEINGRAVSVNFARPVKGTLSDKNAVWADQDAYQKEADAAT